MSYDIQLVGADYVPDHEEGGTIVVGGTPEAKLNITYNYSQFYYDSLDLEKGIRWLYGKTGKETTSRLRRATMLLGTDRDEDYWKATSGNAGYVLSLLLSWAESNPDAVWQGD